MLKKNDVVTAAALKKEYRSHLAVNVLGDVYLKSVERKSKKGRYKYRLVKTPLSLIGFNNLRDAKYKTTVFQLVGEAIGEIESLKDELQEWYDNLPESFQSGQKGDDLQSAIDALEASLADIPDELQAEGISNLTLIYLPLDEKVGSRSSRCREVENMLKAIAERLRQNTLADALDDAAGILEDVEFPGMY